MPRHGSTPPEARRSCSASASVVTFIYARFCTGTAKTKEQSQRRAHNLSKRMVSNDRSVYKEGHARNSSWPGELISTQRPHTFAQTCLLVRNFSLAVVRRTIHSFGVSTVCGTCLPGGCAVAPHSQGDWTESAEGDPNLLWGRSPHLAKARSGFWEGERASEGRGGG